MPGTIALNEDLLDAGRSPLGTISIAQWRALGLNNPSLSLRRRSTKHVTPEQYAKFLAIRRKVSTKAAKTVGEMTAKLPFLAVAGLRLEMWLVGDRINPQGDLTYAWLVHDGDSVLELRFGAVTGITDPARSGMMAVTVAYANAADCLARRGLNVGRLDVATDNETAHNLMSGAWNPPGYYGCPMPAAFAAVARVNADALAFVLHRRAEAKPLRNFHLETAEHGPSARKVDLAVTPEGEVCELQGRDPEGRAGPTLSRVLPVPRGQEATGGGELGVLAIAPAVRAD